MKIVYNLKELKQRKCKLKKQRNNLFIELKNEKVFILFTN